jgi:hypothetical protein
MQIQTNNLIMATTDSTQNDVIIAWQNLIEKSVKANTTFLQESAKIFTDILSKKIETKDLFKINTEVLSAAANNLIKLNISNTENLVNFGINVSKSLFSFTNSKTGENTGTEAKSETTVATNERGQIKLSISQGQSLTTSFYLNSHNAFAQSGKFNFQQFINESTGKEAAISMQVFPQDFILEPGKSIKVDITLNAATDVAPGKYKSTVRLDGMDNQEFDVVVKVFEDKREANPISQSASATKKSAAKNNSNKKAVTKKAASKESNKK